MKAWLGEYFDRFLGSSRKAAHIDAWSLELMNSQPPAIKAIAVSILNVANLQRLLVLETNATYPTILTLRFLVFGLIQNIHDQLPLDTIQENFELSLQDLSACYYMQNVSQKMANAMCEEMQKAVKQINRVKKISHLNVLEVLDYYIAQDLKSDKEKLTSAEKRIAVAKSLLAEKEEYLRSGKDLSSFKSPSWQYYMVYCWELYDADPIAISQQIAKDEEEYQKQLRCFEAKQKLSERIISEIAIAAQTPSQPANTAAIMEFTEEIHQEWMRKSLSHLLSYLEEARERESLQVSQVITMPHSDSLCIPALLAFHVKLETFFKDENKDILHSPAFYRIFRLYNKYKLRIRDELNFDLNALSDFKKMAIMVGILDKPFTSEALRDICVPLDVVNFYRATIPHLHNRELFFDIWQKHAPESYRNFKFDLDDKILRFNTFSTPLLTSKIDFSLRPHELDMFLASDTLITAKKNTLAFVIQETRGHTAALFLERQADGKWNGVYLDSAADPVQMCGNLQHLVQCPNIGSVITYTRYLRRDDADSEFVERALQATKTECGSAAVNFLSMMSKRSQNGKAIYQELMEFAQQAMSSIDKHPEHFEYQNAKKNLPDSPKLFVFPILAAPAYLIKISQSDAILRDFALIHEGDAAAFELHNRRKESLQDYRVRQKSISSEDTIMHRKKRVYADRIAQKSFLGSAGFWQVASAKPQFIVPETDNPALKNLALRMKGFCEKYMVMETLKLSVTNNSTELCINGYVKPQGFDEILGILTLSINPCNLAAGNLGSMRFRIGSEGFSRTRGEDIKFDLVISKHDSQYGLLLDGMAYGYKFQPEKTVFIAELIDKGFNRHTNTEMTLQSFTKMTQSGVEMKITYNGYNTDCRYWGDAGVELKNFPLKALLRLGFGIDFPDIFDANDNPLPVNK